MKTINNILSLLLLSLVVVACSRNYDAPPLNKPNYEGPEANITIGELKKMYSDVVQGSPKLIDADYILSGYIVGNDVSGNVFKQLYIQDDTGAMSVGVDQNNMATQYHIGQQVYLNLHGLYIVEYGKELQIGYDKTQANRIPWEIFQKHVALDNWPNAKAVEPKPAKMNALTDAMVNTIVRFDNVSFEGGGELPYTENNQTTNRTLKSADGQIVVRSSSYSTFAADILPKGTGTVCGLLGRHMGTWQLILRSVDDVYGFDANSPGEEPGEEPGDGPGEETGDVYFKETFGNKDYSYPNRPKIDEFEDADMKDKGIKYSDPSRRADIRTTSQINPHVWFPATSDAQFIIEGIDLSKGKDVVLSFDLAAFIPDGVDKANLNTFEVLINGKAATIPSQEVSSSASNDFFTIKLDSSMPLEKDVKIEFKTKSSNVAGFRLDNITLSEKK